jgi:hypothetical protein
VGAYRYRFAQADHVWLDIVPKLHVTEKLPGLAATLSNLICNEQNLVFPAEIIDRWQSVS